MGLADWLAQTVWENVVAPSHLHAARLSQRAAPDQRTNCQSKPELSRDHTSIITVFSTRKQGSFCGLTWLKVSLTLSGANLCRKNPFEIDLPILASQVVSESGQEPSQNELTFSQTRYDRPIGAFWIPLFRFGRSVNMANHPRPAH